MARQGLNCTLSYMQGRTRRAYRVRVDLLAHGMQVIADESVSRTRRAFYPHRLSSAQFAIRVRLVGEDEYKSFVNWMATYADYVLDLDLRDGQFPAMTVQVPSRSFIKKGVPLSGFEWSDRVGAMLWSPQVVFETSEEPSDLGKQVATSRVTGLVALTDKDMRYFYPTGTQLSGSQTPPDGTYSIPVDSESLAALAAQSGINTDPSADGSRSLTGGLTR